MGEKNQTKTDALILHFAKNISYHLGSKKLAKLLYFVDFTAYEMKEDSITGEKYMKYQYGPMPKRYYQIIKKMEGKKLITYKPQKDEFTPASIKARVEPDYSVFSGDEVKIIQMITDKYRNSTASELEKLAKAEPPYKMVNFNEDIPYHLAFYRNSFGEMELIEKNGD